ncbi:galactarate dehydratase [Reinekea forsetii]|uniref:Galactarate dehydratase n=1 Tax=Reinekea forsetii TaxID=1336806 RepID=A0A2K8KPD8_9GAMM|nr:galactarate dehydratase [Reinekea forsetii]
MVKQVFKLHSSDNVFVALANLPLGTELEVDGVILTENVQRGHKIAAEDIAEGMPVIRYGHIIGQATMAIAAGDHVHGHNLGMGEHHQDSIQESYNTALPILDHERTFMGYLRRNGQVGTRNYIGILTSVNCAGSVANFIAEAAEKSGLLDAFPNVDGIVPIVHSSGCGMAGDGDGYETLKRTLIGYSKNPNFGAILLVGLGCEVLQVSTLAEGFSQTIDNPHRYMTIQGEGGTRKTVDRGLEELRIIAEIANRSERSPAPLSALTVGMQCGGSDGYSGITANPALGAASDLLVRHGGTTILSETSEIYGAEHLLTRRAVNPSVAEKLLARVRWWEDYCSHHGGEMNNNPSPGNKAGGLTTILEKSLGAVAKSGTAPLTEVYGFAEQIDKKGFVFMDSPGYDPCSVTGQVASGANLIVFTTGRGSVSGFKPSPCIKLATNSEMYRRMSSDMDLNCGDIVSEGVSIEAKGEEIFELIIRIASGEMSKSEAQGFGGVEFVPWQIGAVM